MEEILKIFKSLTTRGKVVCLLFLALSTALSIYYTGCQFVLQGNSGDGQYSQEANQEVSTKNLITLKKATSNAED